MKNIHDQQIQMAMFLKEYYEGRAVALNDIGAVSFLADPQLVDLWGLGSMEPARCKLRKRYGTQEMEEISRERGVTIALLYDAWFRVNGSVELPRGWVRAGQWRIPDNVVCGSDTVSLYGVDVAAGEELMERLRKFGKEMPAEVTQDGEYVEAGR